MVCNGSPQGLAAAGRGPRADRLEPHRVGLMQCRRARMPRHESHQQAPPRRRPSRRPPEVTREHVTAGATLLLPKHELWQPRMVPRGPAFRATRGTGGACPGAARAACKAGALSGGRWALAARSAHRGKPCRLARPPSPGEAATAVFPRATCTLGAGFRRDRTASEMSSARSSMTAPTPSEAEMRWASSGGSCRVSEPAAAKAATRMARPSESRRSGERRW
jgi:hypothetical protein